MPIGTATAIIAGLAAAASTAQMVQANDQKQKAQKAADKQGDEQKKLKADADAKIDAEDQKAASAAARAIARERGGAAPGLGAPNGAMGTTTLGTMLGGSSVPAGMGVATHTLGMPSPIASTGGTKTLLGS